VVSGIGNNQIYTYNGEVYKRPSYADAEMGFWAASIAAGALKALLPSFSNPFLKQMQTEHGNNYLYKDVFEKAVDMSGLKEKGLKIVNLQFSPAETMINPSEISHYDVKAGLNAFFAPSAKQIVLNQNKASISGFHELGHAMNNMSGKLGKVLQKMRGPGYWVAGLMGIVALFGRTKPKGAKRNAWDWIQDNCHWIAAVGMLPTVAEEALASYKGVKAAKAAGLADNLVKNLKKFYGKALLSYAGYAAVTGLSVYAVSKITEMFTRPRKIN